MIKFIIVDNEEKWQIAIKDIVTKAAFKLDNIKIEVYNCLNANLEKTIRNNDYHKVYILDIELGSSISGLEIAKLIRDIDHFSHIIFLTNHDSMFEEVHRNLYEVYSFIEKFHNTEDRLLKALESVVAVEFDTGVFRYSTRSMDLQIFCNEILYIERDTFERKILIHTKERTYAINMTIEKILTMLDSRFRQVHRSCIVNDDKVIIYNWTKGEFTLNSGLIIPMLSKKYRKKDEVK